MGWEKNGVLEHESGNISETRKDRGKVTMEGLYEIAGYPSVCQSVTLVDCLYGWGEGGVRSLVSGSR